MKSFLFSKTIWASILVIASSAGAVAVEVWGQLSPEQVAHVKDWFGPETTALIGIVMLVLRIVTTTGVSMRSDK